jgi:hypothetical protein
VNTFVRDPRINWVDTVSSGFFPLLGLMVLLMGRLLIVIII